MPWTKKRDDFDKASDKLWSDEEWAAARQQPPQLKSYMVDLQAQVERGPNRHTGPKAPLHVMDERGVGRPLRKKLYAEHRRGA